MLTKRVRSIKNSITRPNELLNRAYIWKLSGFKPKNVILFENKKYIVKTVETVLELEKALNLRYEVYYRELINKSSIIKLDIDRYDLISDHIVIVEKCTKEVIGTYRVISSTFSDCYYSESEFNIDKIKNVPVNKLELGRACVHRNYRNGLTLAMLWKGVSLYIDSLNIRYLFGCSSVNTTNILEISLIYKFIRDMHLSGEDLRVYPKDKFRVIDIANYLDAFEKFSAKAENIEDFIPPLLKAYLKAGSKICGEPALDRKFRCADFFTVLDTDLMSDKFEKRYKAVNA